MAKKKFKKYCYWHFCTYFTDELELFVVTVVFPASIAVKVTLKSSERTLIMEGLIVTTSWGLASNSRLTGVFSDTFFTKKVTV